MKRIGLLFIVFATASAVACGDDTSVPPDLGIDFTLKRDNGPVDDKGTQDVGPEDGAVDGDAGLIDVGPGEAGTDAETFEGGVIDQGQDQTQPDDLAVDDTSPGDTQVTLDAVGDTATADDAAADDADVVIDAAPDTQVVIDTGVPDAPVDAPAPDAPAPDAPAPDAPQVDGFVAPDAPLSYDGLLLDGAVLADMLPILNDAGLYMCTSLAGTTVPCQCNDGIDNDADGKIDYPDDPGCTAAWDNNEIDGTTECSDGIDNDGDGLIDAADPHCTGMLDNDESSFGTNIPGDNMDCKQDCFFDGNSGGGDDGCEWNLRCDPLDPTQYISDRSCPYYGDPVPANKCDPSQSQQCLDFCLPITPNGCDCFGCCEFPSGDGGATITVMLVNTCTIADINDPNKCPPCTQVQDCLNPCGICEICIGKPTIDPSCIPKMDAGVPSDGGLDGAIPLDDAGQPLWDAAIEPDGGVEGPCAPDVIYCGPGGVDPNQCPPGTYCVTGCCVSTDVL